MTAFSSIGREGMNGTCASMFAGQISLIHRSHGHFAPQKYYCNFDANPAGPVPSAASAVSAWMHFVSMHVAAPGAGMDSAQCAAPGRISRFVLPRTASEGRQEPRVAYAGYEWR